MPRFIRNSTAISIAIAVFITMISCSIEEIPISGELPVEGAENFRSLGGYKTKDGREFKEGLLYRSGHLHNLTKADSEYLTQIGVRSIADFRGPSEVEDEPDTIPEGISYLSYPVDVAGSDLREKIVSVIRGDSEMDMTGYMLDINRQFALNYSETYGRWIHNIIDNPDSLPQVFHCTAGKDRAGFAAALLLRITAVPVETIMADYLESNEYNAEYIEKTIRKIKVLTFFKNDGEVIRPLLAVDSLYLQTAFDAIDSEWGSFENYVSQGLKLNNEDIEALKNRLLE